MKTYGLKTNQPLPAGMKLGDVVYLSGTLLTARDQAHKKIVESIAKRKKLPFALKGVWIFHAGPIVHKRKNKFELVAIGSTTSSRLQKYNSLLQKQGVQALIGKGGVGKEGLGKMLYFTYPGGCAALGAKMLRIGKVCWLDLGTAEAVWQLRAKNFGPLILTTKGKKTLLR